MVERYPDRSQQKVRGRVLSMLTILTGLDGRHYKASFYNQWFKFFFHAIGAPEHGILEFAGCVSPLGMPISRDLW